MARISLIVLFSLALSGCIATKSIKPVKAASKPILIRVTLCGYTKLFIFVDHGKFFYVGSPRMLLRNRKALEQVHKLMQQLPKNPKTGLPGMLRLPINQRGVSCLNRQSQA